MNFFFSFNFTFTLWGPEYSLFRLIIDNKSPGYIQAIYTGAADSIYTFNMTLSQTPTPNSGPNNILQPNMTGNWMTGW